MARLLDRVLRRNPHGYNRRSWKLCHYRRDWAFRFVSLLVFSIYVFNTKTVIAGCRRVVGLTGAKAKEALELAKSLQDRLAELTNKKVEDPSYEPIAKSTCFLLLFEKCNCTNTILLYI